MSDFLQIFYSQLPPTLQRVWEGLSGPIEIQRYLDTLPYIGEERNRSPLQVMLDGQCHCLDGALLAALALRRLGEPGLLLDLRPALDEQGRPVDDDHVLTLFRRNGLWGAIAKSNFPWLRYREPVYRSLHELAMTYFEVYFDIHHLKTLRAYTRPFDIARFDHAPYPWDEASAARLYAAFYRRKAIALFPEEAARALQPVDQRAFESGSLGTDWNWTFSIRKEGERER